jgi:hypothetical protein
MRCKYSFISHFREKIVDNLKYREDVQRVFYVRVATSLKRNILYARFF